jgi:hypothetical protein
MEKYNMILAAEEQFAREVTLGRIVQRPIAVWSYLIPGMFIIDYLRRGSAVRLYTKHFMFPRNLALNMARSMSGVAENKIETSQISKDISTGLQSLKLDSRNMQKASEKMVHLLADHYLKLIKNEGNDYCQLIWNTYQNRRAFQSHLDLLMDAEKEVDRAILEKLGDTEKVREKLSVERQQIEMRRQKLADEIF